MRVTLRYLPLQLILASACAVAVSVMAQTPAADPTRTPAVADFSTCPKPVWPLASLRKEEEGTVTLRFLIGVDGDVKESMVLKSSGSLLLDQAAQEGISRCKFKPGTSNGQATAGWMQMQYVWSLKPAATPKQLVAEYESVRWLAEGGDLPAQYKLAMLLATGKGVTKDDAAAKAQLISAAGRGYAPAQDRLGTFAMGGIGGKADLAEAMQWFRKAAEQGLAQSQAMLGNLLMNPKYPGNDLAEAKVWLRKAAAQGNAQAQSNLGRILWNEAGEQGDVGEALALLDSAAANGERNAQFYVGRAYETGRGVVRDAAKAAQWYQSAVSEGEPKAHLALARLYETGEGVTKDPARADALKQKAVLLSR